MTSVRTKLLEAKQKKLIVRFARPFEQGTMFGYVLDVGEKFFLLASLNDAIEFDQYICARLKDVRRLKAPAEYASFYLKARKAKQEKLPKRIKLDLTDAVSILRSIGTSLLTIHSENVAPDSCNIGVVTSDNGIDYEFWNISPSAEWDKKPCYYRLNEITRIDLPGPYEKTLLLVGGDPPV